MTFPVPCWVFRVMLRYYADDGTTTSILSCYVDRSWYYVSCYVVCYRCLGGYMYGRLFALNIWDLYINTLAIGMLVLLIYWRLLWPQR